MQKKQIIINGNIITYLISDNFDSKNTTIFMHGWGHDKYSFKEILNLYEKNNLSFISLDFPGFGESPKPKTDWGVQEYAETITSFIKKTGLSHTNFVAHSFGGRVAIYITANKLLDINKQVLVASGGIKPNQNKLRLFFIKICKNILVNILPQSIYKKLQKNVRSTDYINAQNMEKIFLNTINYDLKPLLSQIDTPTKLIRGSDDDQTPINDGIIMNNEIKNSSLYIIKGGTHFVHIENFETVFDQIKNFLFSVNQ